MYIRIYTRVCECEVSSATLIIRKICRVLHTHSLSHTHTHTTHTLAHSHAYIYVYTYTHTHTHTHTHMYTYIYIYACIYSKCLSASLSLSPPLYACTYMCSRHGCYFQGERACARSLSMCVLKAWVYMQATTQRRPQ